MTTYPDAPYTSAVVIGRTQVAALSTFLAALSLLAVVIGFDLYRLIIDGAAHEPLFVGSVMIEPLAIRRWLVAASFILLGASGILKAVEATRAPERRPRRSALGAVRLVLVAVTFATVILLGCTSLIGGLLRPGLSYQELYPAGPDGCRIIVESQTGLFHYSGRFLLRRPGEFHLVDSGRTWSRGPDSAPPNMWQWLLTWNGHDAKLKISSQLTERSDPTYSVHC